MKRNDFLGTVEPEEPPPNPFFADKPAEKPKEDVKTLHLPKKPK